MQLTTDQSSSITIRPVQKEDNPAIAQLIREVMTEFGAIGSGFSIADPEVDHIFEAYDAPNAAYKVLVNQDGKIIGGGGFAHLVGGDADTCELKKMYFYPEARGTGFGKQLVIMLMAEAKSAGFHKMYIETIEKMANANVLYRKLGFVPLPGAKGNTGHTGCGLFYIMDL